MTETAGHVFPGAPAMAMATRRTIANGARGALLPIEHGHGAGPLRNLDLNLVQLTAIGWLVIDVGRQRRPIISTHAVPVLFDEVPFRPNPNIIAMILRNRTLSNWMVLSIRNWILADRTMSKLILANRTLSNRIMADRNLSKTILASRNLSKRILANRTEDHCYDEGRLHCGKGRRALILSGLGWFSNHKLPLHFTIGIHAPSFLILSGPIWDLVCLSFRHTSRIFIQLIFTTIGVIIKHIGP
mmetsp:Transcript_5694/g.7045  ORF Transcript_5694/g.7045 Transcript_5694/m.7045 type:complete len:243 (+) Transcript_5694:194-922(+)